MFIQSTGLNGSLLGTRSWVCNWWMNLPWSLSAGSLQSGVRPLEIHQPPWACQQDDESKRYLTTGVLNVSASPWVTLARAQLPRALWEVPGGCVRKARSGEHHETSRGEAKCRKVNQDRAGLYIGSGKRPEGWPKAAPGDEKQGGQQGCLR